MLPATVINICRYTLKRVLTSCVTKSQCAPARKLFNKLLDLKWLLLSLALPIKTRAATFN